ncbi:MAG TPA: hypothetical protein VJL90_04005 [Pseudorhodoplanes sp.]|nr:hypothetical protein [Pseudorhodoplanes sp.]
MFAEGMLAIWSDVPSEAETDYLHWLTREHAVERLSTAGFVSVRLFRAMDLDIRRYFIVYDLESPSALSGEDYVGKLNNPTPWTQRVMPMVRNFVRGGGRVTAASGTGHGGFAAAIVLEDANAAEATSLLPKLVKTDRICSARLLTVDRAGTSVATREKSLRRDDQSFANLLVFDGLDAVAVRSALDTTKSLAPDGATPHLVYKQVYQLDRRQVPGV